MSVKASKDTSIERVRIKQKKEALEEYRKKLQEGLPHLYGQKFFWWSRKFYESYHRLVFISASNQSSKSSTQIRRCINFATDPSTWAKLSRVERPTLFFYFYPSLKLARQEINHKWIPQFLPRGEFKDHPQYGWKITDNSDKLSIRFNTGVEVVFCGYSQGKGDLLALAASSPSAIFIDEECPPELLPEIFMRVEATKGIVNMVLTPVVCYPYYKEIFEGRVVFEDALVMTVSMYECLKFEDGTEGLYTLKDIENRKSRLGSQAQIDQRIFGKYTTPEGLQYEQFRREKNVKEPFEIPAHWIWFAGIDIGSSGGNHPAAIAFVACSPDYRKAAVAHIWAGNEFEQTSNSDILNKYLELRDQIVGTKPFGGCYYDHSNKDFELISLKSMVAGVQKADKARDFGVGLLNALFKNEMLDILQSEEAQNLVNELENLRVEVKKQHAKDDRIDAMRYAVSRIPWDFSHISVDKTVQPDPVKVVEPFPLNDRRHPIHTNPTPILDVTEEELSLWQEYLED
jgi:hypothetical protein